MIDATTTTMLKADACPNRQLPPIDRWNTKWGMFVEPGPPQDGQNTRSTDSEDQALPGRGS